MTSKPMRAYRTRLLRGPGMCAIPVPFDPKDVFGKVRAPVKVTINGYTYRSTISAMGGPACIPLRKSHQEAAGVEDADTVDVRLELDTEERKVTPQSDFVKALKAAPPAWDRWQELSYTHQREYVEALDAAKQPHTRTRRLEKAVQEIGVRKPAAKRSARR